MSRNRMSVAPSITRFVMAEIASSSSCTPWSRARTLSLVRLGRPGGDCSERDEMRLLRLPAALLIRGPVLVAREDEIGSARSGTAALRGIAVDDRGCKKVESYAEIAAGGPRDLLTSRSWASGHGPPKWKLHLRIAGANPKPGLQHYLIVSNETWLRAWLTCRPRLCSLSACGRGPIPDVKQREETQTSPFTISMPVCCTLPLSVLYRIHSDRPTIESIAWSKERKSADRIDAVSLGLGQSVKTPALPSAYPFRLSICEILNL